MKRQPYVEIQKSWWLVAIMAAVIILIIVLAITQWGNNPMPLWLLWIFVPLFILPVLLFYRMQTVVDDKYIHISYGIGWIRKTIELDRVAEASATRIPWYYGAGIKYLSKGTLYSMNFTGAVKLDFRKSYGSSGIMIGSSTPETLAAEINNRLSANIDTTKTR